ncbi:MAG: transposase [Actinobacteria bacterium]|nr:transposase [Actinomycetota bacterium]
MALPNARLAVDHFHLIMLVNKAVTGVRQRVTRQLLGRRGPAVDPAWANRHLLPRGRERLYQAALARMWNGCIDHKPQRDDPDRVDCKGGAPRAVRNPPPPAGTERTSHGGCGPFTPGAPTLTFPS